MTQTRHLPKRGWRTAAAGIGMLLGAALCGNAQATGWLWDQDGDKIDDRIEQVGLQGISAAFETGDSLLARQRIAIRDLSATPLRFGVYVGYEQRPTEADLQALRDSGVSTAIMHPYLYIDYVRMELTLGEIQTVATLPNVSRVEAIPMVYAVNDIAAATGGVFDRSNTIFPSVHEHLGLTGQGVVVSVLDTGVNDDADVATGFPGHESVIGKFIAGGEFFAGQPALNTASDASTNPIDRGEAASSNHGTHVAGTAIGIGRPDGLFQGMAPGATLIDQKVLSDAGLGFGSADGVEWAVINKEQYNIRVLNLSLGGLDASDGTDAGSQMMNAAFDAGLLPVIAMGNDGETNYVSSPAAATKALAIGSYNDQNTIARADDLISDFSNEGPRADDGTGDPAGQMKPLVAAPGSGILSADGSLTTDGLQYKSLGGTSMATPGVAGIIALMLEANPSLTPTEVVEILKHTSDHIDDWGKTAVEDNPFAGEDPNYHPSGGWGRVNAYAAAKEALRLAGDAASQVQVVQIYAEPVASGEAAIDVLWVSQREIDLQGYNVYRAPDVGGTPGAFAQINATLIPGTGGAAIEKLNNRNTYTLTDTDGLEFGNVYWYRIEHVSAAGTFQEPAYPVTLGQTLPVARLRYSITHNAIDNDLLILLGSGVSFAHAETIISGRPAGEADAVTEVPGEATTGNLQHDFSITLTNRDLASVYMPPSARQPWFLRVSEGGFVNRTGQVNSFAIDLFDENGDVIETLETGDLTPQPLVETQSVELWIPSNPTTPTPGAAPILASVDPEGAVQGSADISASFLGSQFLAQATITIAGEGVTVTDAEVVSGNEATALISVAEDAAAGPRDVTITNVDGQSDTLAGAFTVVLAGSTEEPEEPGEEPEEPVTGGSDPVGDRAPTGSSGALAPGLLLILLGGLALRRSNRSGNRH